jgi:hypothetical protein
VLQAKAKVAFELQAKVELKANAKRVELKAKVASLASPPFACASLAFERLRAKVLQAKA